MLTDSVPTTTVGRLRRADAADGFKRGTESDDEDRSRVPTWIPAAAPSPLRVDVPTRRPGRFPGVSRLPLVRDAAARTSGRIRTGKAMEGITDRLLNWASVIEENPLEQARRTSTMPFIHPHLALMPDAHLGLGATVGSVIPTLGAVMPAAVGVDIGCGMIAVRTQFTAADLPPDRRPLREQIERAVPTSARAYNRQVVATAQPRVAEL